MLSFERNLERASRRDTADEPTRQVKVKHVKPRGADHHHDGGEEPHSPAPGYH